jgi:hypothetical protein
MSALIYFSLEVITQTQPELKHGRKVLPGRSGAILSEGMVDRGTAACCPQPTHINPVLIYDSHRGCSKHTRYFPLNNSVVWADDPRVFFSKDT